MAYPNEPDLITWVFKRGNLPKLWSEREMGKLKGQRGSTLPARRTERGLGAQDAGNGFSPKVSGMGPGPVNTLILASDTHV